MTYLPVYVTITNKFNAGYIDHEAYMAIAVETQRDTLATIRWTCIAHVSLCAVKRYK
jgi:hypothetical protein